MSIYVKSAAVVAVVVAALVIYRTMHGIAVTGSGGLGAVSFGVSEALLVELVALVAVAWVFFYWRARRRKSSKSAARR